MKLAGLNKFKISNTGVSGGNAQVDDVIYPHTFSNDDSEELVGTIPNKVGSATLITPNTTDQAIPKGYYGGVVADGKVVGDADLVTSNIKAGVNIFGITGKATVVDTADATAAAGDILNGDTAYVFGNKITGTMANNGAITITPSTTNQTIVAGYHNGSGYVVGDSDLVTGNIKAGANIFGVSGKVSVVDTSDATAVSGHIRNGATAYVNGSKLTGTLTIQSTTAQTITPTTTDIVKGAGIYDGAITIAGDADLVTGNIKSGVNIFGVAGKASVVETANANAVAANILSGKTAYVNGALITGTMVNQPGTITANSWYSDGAGNFNHFIPYGAYLSDSGSGSGTPNVVAHDNNFVPGNIKPGVSIFGVTGTYQPTLSSLGVPTNMPLVAVIDSGSGHYPYMGINGDNISYINVKGWWRYNYNDITLITRNRKTGALVSSNVLSAANSSTYMYPLGSVRSQCSDGGFNGGPFNGDVAAITKFTTGVAFTLYPANIYSSHYNEVTNAYYCISIRAGSDAGLYKYNSSGALVYNTASAELTAIRNAGTTYTDPDTGESYTEYTYEETNTPVCVVGGFVFAVCPDGYVRRFYESNGTYVSKVACNTNNTLITDGTYLYVLDNTWQVNQVKKYDTNLSLVTIGSISTSNSLAGGVKLNYLGSYNGKCYYYTNPKSQDAYNALMDIAELTPSTAYLQNIYSTNFAHSDSSDHDDVEASQGCIMDVDGNIYFNGKLRIGYDYGGATSSLVKLILNPKILS